MTTKTTHTPGQWTIHTTTFGEAVGVAGPDGCHIASLPGGVSNRDANAHLIASAPDLVAVLRAIVSALGGSRDRNGKVLTTMIAGEPLRRLAIQYSIGSSSDTIEQAVKVADAALAKADGRMP